MTATLPAAIHNLQTDWDVDARARSAFAGTGEAIPATRNIKTGGWLPISGSGSTAIQNNQASSATGPLRGVYWEFLASGGYDVSTDTRVMILCWQWNAVNRIQLATIANDGCVVRLGTGAGSPPANYRTYNVAGNDTFAGKSQAGTMAAVIDLNDATHDTLIGTYDNTDVETFGFGTVRFNLNGTANNQYFFSRLFVFETTATGSMPEFTGTSSDWSQLSTLVLGTSYTNQLSADWIRLLGDTTLFLASPWRIGDGTTATTFNDNGWTIIGPAHNQASDPRIRITSQAMRAYIRLRNNAADVVTLSGTYDYRDAEDPVLDFNVSNASSILLSGSTWIGRGDIELGSSVSTGDGGATFEQCGIVDVNGGDVDNSNFTDQRGTHALLLTSAQTLTAVSFANYASNHAIEIDTAGTYNLDNVFFDQSGTNDIETTHATGTVTLVIKNAGTTPTVTETGAGAVVINHEIPIEVTGVTAGSRVSVHRTSNNVSLLNALAFTADGTGLFKASGLITIDAQFGVTVKARNQAKPTAAYSEDSSVFFDETIEANDSATNMTVIPAASPALNDAYYFGHQEQFGRIKMVVGTAGVGTYGITWEYYNGSVYTALSGVSDGTNGWHNAGENVVSWTIPGDWALRNEPGGGGTGSYYFVRARLSSATSITTTPVGAKVTLDVTRYLAFANEFTLNIPNGLSARAGWVIDTTATF